MTVDEIQRGSLSEVSWSLPLSSRSLPSDVEVGAEATGNWSIFPQFLPDKRVKALFNLLNLNEELLLSVSTDDC